MGRHNELYAPVNTCFECYHLTIKHFIPRLQRLRITIMRIILCVAMSGEMLNTSHNACVLQSLQIVGYHGSRNSRIIGESAIANDYILRIGIDICHRSKVNIKIILFQVFTNGVSTIIRIFLITSSTDSSH